MTDKVEECTSDYREPYVKPVNWLHKLDKLGVEVRGIERVSPEERELMKHSKKYAIARQFVDIFGLWFAACGGLTSMSSFFLPTLLFGLNLRDALISGIISLNFGCLVPAYCSIMGPKSGCRQIVSARFVFGFWGVKLVAIVCVVGLVGWSVVNCVLGGQILAASFGVSLDVGIVVAAVCALVISIFGIKVLLRFQTAFSIPITIANILFYIVVLKNAKYIEPSNELIAEQGYSSLTSRGNWLSFFTIGFSVTATWGGAGADYYIHIPENTPSWQVFTVTFLGIAVPTTLVAVVGIYCGAIAYGNPAWTDVYNTQGVGGLINVPFEPWGRFGKFVVVVLYISLICNNIMNSYSGGVDLQLIDRRMARIPRWCYAILVTAIYLILSLLGKNKFSAIISNFLPMLGYWISIYIAILLEENLIFRAPATRHLHSREFEDDRDVESYSYNWPVWDDPTRITYGLAAMGAFAVGAVGAVVGMNQVYWQGPIARQIGDYGGDIGFFLCFGFAGVAYPLLRFLELKYLQK
ncbi:hypothetical protein PSN45_003237 [Yamadazyma tenuis]|uniref:Purine-cytosine permease n=1 Tax=Candida tenuis (strain ATCC 10573 / BCRC 21748 / CBS 615 / JCM 9827 / NBRC 10315 / NRRL Y-1498 / VKM Y-70) TaxID=590646 RepID=G3AYX8_CANTC|nr:uncharacterized protein CANTEDRAFT_92303 [Yamadazyma tenuis ATCC 10573]EGV65957.1 hypothetical protein CANTEDRAFT_92303 [Yamadazyma tenuis ATCC 10573]WEJ95710.1 hypothetical protein PSN45_003237 [Yamadazyma tenuis]